MGRINMKIAYILPESNKAVGPYSYSTEIINYFSRKYKTEIFRKVSDFRRINQYDIVHIPDIMWANLKLLNYIYKPIIVDVHDYYWIKKFFYPAPDIFLRWLNQIRLKRRYLKVLKKVHTVITHCKYVGRLVPHNHIRYVSQGININEIKINDIEFENREKKVIMVGGNYFRKGFYTLWKAVKLLEKENFPINVEIYGKERKHTFYLAKKMTQNTSIKLFEPIQRELLYEKIQQSLIFLLPSYIEAFPFTIMEAMACHTPVIATNVGGIPEIIQNNFNGILIKKGDYKTLAHKIVELSTNKKLWTTLKNNAFHTVKEIFTFEDMVKNIEDVYFEVLRFKKKIKNFSLLNFKPSLQGKS